MDWHTRGVEPALRFLIEWIYLMGSLSRNETSAPFSEFLRHQTCAAKGLGDWRGEFPPLGQLVRGGSENLAGGWALPRVRVPAGFAGAGPVLSQVETTRQQFVSAQP